MTLPTLYLRREPTSQGVPNVDDSPERFDIVAYRDKAMTDAAGRWPWFYQSKPRKGAKTVMLNCMRHRAAWRPDHHGETPFMLETRRAMTAATMQMDALISRLHAEGRKLALAGTVAYSKAHPRRTVTFVSAMGSNCLHVTPGGTSYRGEYQLTTGDHGDYPPPAWMEELDRLCDDYRLGTFPDNLKVVCKGGKIIEQVSNW
ncbi:hypothetical protein HOU00_gp121 [Caulobacter phage CcrPW]|uniref:Uncharacterized protein n=1 Tax=Caulobacter phage CcrPW TaxID=2283271 RepID=A0A385EAV7_9CAUD|nr:hypothetical protein HOU00_gp016 [Caulobacter phage CcrPW]YP_009809634.1 hypothetical protein HOU00_gp121 [Caulobacter phage CcrPW]AXQ68555.1 hypothetical protein CcrPW_gp016 [Caulobacter phage CcrPW]AXQ69004.1 hypothetical protein CcrPW_gp465 [Caulobacter phage CcrPW]